ncbi:MAG TPA: tetratricopeptide repeat protein [Bryobacteraceae bacterium]|nr:tetratricopeptide repeat protein [Bryobacteraceae bacterium]
MIAPAEPITLGPFSVDTSNQRLLRDGVEVRLRPQAVLALATLVQNSGTYINCDRMIREAWGGIVVSPHTVEVTVSEVKKALSEYGSWISRRPKLGYRLEIPGSEDLIRSGWHFWNRRTREGFEKAIDCFQRAAQEDSADFRVFEGLSLCHLMLGVYGMRRPSEMRQGFAEAHRRAVELAGWTPELRAMHAHALRVFERKYDAAEAEFRRVLREKPSLVSAYVWLAMLLLTQGRLDEALALIVRAHRVDPLYPALAATEIFIRFCRRDLEAAIACGKRAVDLFPYLQLGRAYYAEALEYSGQVEEALKQYRIGRLMSPDFACLRALEGICLARNGRQKKARAILDDLEKMRASEYVDAYFIALLHSALGDRDAAFREMERAVEEESPNLNFLDVDPKLDSLRKDRRFTRLRNRFMGDPAASAPAPRRSKRAVAS